jgi:hypothetical protein
MPTKTTSRMALGLVSLLLGAGCLAGCDPGPVKPVRVTAAAASSTASNASRPVMLGDAER